MQNINIDNIDRDIFLFELSSYICNRQLRHVLLSSYVRVYVRSTVFLFFLSKKKKKKNGSILEFVIRLGYFEGISYIMANACIASQVRPCICPFICLHSVLSKTMRVL